MNGYGIVLFHTTSAALRAEKVLKAAGLIIKLIPTPRELSSNCGVSVRFAWDQSEQVRSALQGAGIDLADLLAL